MMNTPISDFLKKYKNKDSIRFHMPGHKGRGPNEISNMTAVDITEITGADFLFSALDSGIISQSEKNASELFDSAFSLYSTEGSTLCIKTMLFLVTKGKKNKKVLAARNVHKSFINACALLDIDADWLYPNKKLSSICTMSLTDKDLEAALSSYKKDELPCAVYITSPDYIGNMLDIKSLSSVCRKYNVPLLVDNAHGAYLNFLKDNKHPLYLGADMCCDSAHKTLPCLTGGAYLHISKNTKREFKIKSVLKEAMQLFATTSPSYLILESLDLCNKLLSDGNYTDKLNKTCEEVKRVKSDIKSLGFDIIDNDNDEPLKIVLISESIGLSGYQLMSELEKHNIYCEYADISSVILMISTENNDNDFKILMSALRNIKNNLNISSFSKKTHKLSLHKNEKKLSIREALFCKSETIPLEQALGKVCSSPVSVCPPCIPFIISGEIFDQYTINLLKGYSISHVNVVQYD